MAKYLLFISIVFLSAACDDMSRDLNVKNVKGFNFSLKDVQESCTAEREGDRDIDVRCKDSRLKPLERSCIGRMTAGLRDPKFYCSGGLWVLNDWCYVEMTTQQKGNIRCKRK